MKYPTLTELNTSREMIDVFSGYNHNLRIGEGEFYDMKNLTSADYPVLSPRPKRGEYTFPTVRANPSNLISKDALCYVDEGTLYINKKAVDGLELLYDCSTCPNRLSCSNRNDESKTCPKTMVSMGSYIIIMPDKVWVNTQPKDGEDQHGKIEAEFFVDTGTAKYSLCKVDGEEYKNKVTDEEGNVTEEKEVPALPKEPSDPKNLDLWIDTSSEPHTLKMYSATEKMWVAIPTTYVKIFFPNTTTDLTDKFKEGDGLTFMGIEPSSISDLVGSPIVVWAVGKDYIVVTGILDKVTDQDLSQKPITITRRIPNMDFIIESENRLWGCRYGVAVNGEVVNEIYASKLGDFKNWNSFAGISTDSYAASVGTDGQFTGAITHLGYPIFFKENCMHKVYGNYPANYQIQTTTCRGVQKGCHKSLAIVNEVLYYKSRSAVCAYDGSLPVEISSALGDMTYSNAVAGSLGNKYYISMRDAEDYNLFVYDTKKGMWHKEDKTQVVDFCNCRGNLYYIDYADRKIKTVRELGADEGINESAPIKWQAITGVIGTDSPDKKYISRLNVRLYVEVGATVVIYAEYDSSGEWEHLYTKPGIKLGSFTVPVKPKRCDHMRLRIEGTGVAKIYSICKTIEQGSDI